MLNTRRLTATSIPKSSSGRAEGLPGELREHLCHDSDADCARDVRNPIEFAEGQCGALRLAVRQYGHETAVLPVAKEIHYDLASQIPVHFVDEVRVRTDRFNPYIVIPPQTLFDAMIAIRTQSLSSRMYRLVSPVGKTPRGRGWHKAQPNACHIE
ncbi:hypothetical protein CSUB01_12655 [Colletotrichum sublineola]|uniref:Uncharacterized protein n=1 Tax=Colletotrichum sublineola TaxID=1173701 RepID=A0A066X708_COLSU|nr:hypothetical protein CSUB01_12655 [Colletotrichum sublineola]